MSNGWQVGWEGGGEIIAHAVVHKALTFPMKIVMMRDDGVARFSDEFTDGKPKRNIQRDGAGVLDDERLQFELVREFIKFLLDVKP